MGDSAIPLFRQVRGRLQTNRFVVTSNKLKSRKTFDDKDNRPVQALMGFFQFLIRTLRAKQSKVRRRGGILTC